METSSAQQKREMADLKHQQKLNLGVRRLPEALESPFAGLLRSCRQDNPLSTKFATLCM